jgi:HEAT repeat protein
MHKLCCSLAFFLYLAIGLATASQKTSEVQRLFAELMQPTTTDNAAHAILELANRDQGARGYVVQRLPEIIEKRPTDPIWINAVRLAGRLKASETVAALMKALPRGNVGQGTVTISEYMRLDTDLVGKALAEIGDASVAPLAEVLKHSDQSSRHRAAIILLNINSTLSRKVLRDDLQTEKDPSIRKLIESELNS